MLPWMTAESLAAPPSRSGHTGRVQAQLAPVAALDQLDRLRPQRGAARPRHLGPALQREARAVPADAQGGAVRTVRGAYAAAAERDAQQRGGAGYECRARWRARHFGCETRSLFSPYRCWGRHPGTKYSRVKGPRQRFCSRYSASTAAGTRARALSGIISAIFFF
jgi:hypothetical protein